MAGPKMMFRRIAVSGWILIAVSMALYAVAAAGIDPGKIRQPPPGMVQILKTSDGSTLIGRITKVEGGRISFATGLTTIEVPIESIVDLSEAPESSVKGGKYWFPDPSETRLYLFPTAKMLPRGDGYFADYYVFFAAAGYGLTDWLSLGGGISLFPGVPLHKQLYYVTPKVGIEATERLHLSAGALVLKVPGFSDDEGVPLVGVLDAVATYGGRDGTLTAGAGFGFVDNKVADKPLVLLGGSWRFSRRVAFVSENWIVPGVENAMISYGLRLMGESISVDLAFFTPTGEDFIFPGVPFVAFAFSF
jgi:hypothetical protein